MLEPKLDYRCKGCGKECDSAPIDGSGACCPDCCEDHDYVYDPDHREHRCRHCDESAPPDWYDVDP